LSQDNFNSINGEASISRELHGTRFDQAAAILFPEFSRSRLQAWIGAGALTLDGQTARAKDKVTQGQHLVLAAAVEPAVSTRVAVNEGGKPAITHYRIAERFSHHTSLSVSLETGRTHQIRVHLASRNNPLIGDPVYGGRPRPPAGANTELQTALRTFSRQALHAQTLAFDHPATGQRCQFETPLPDDLIQLLAVLRAHDTVASL
jgi:23S rRNA-/tRNA-specific pseudouridylate synthase